MFTNYLKTSFRNLLRNKSYSIVNITGLVVGFSAFLLIFLVLSYEKSFDAFHTKRDRIYRIYRSDKNDPSSVQTGVPAPVTNGLRTDYPQLENVAAIRSGYNVQVTIPGPGGETLKKFKEKNGVFFAEKRFFEIFDFKIIKGDPATALKEINTGLLSKDMAEKYFGDWNQAIGKTVKAYGLNIKITGVLDNPPPNTDFPLGLVISYQSEAPDMNDWISISDNNTCFVQLPVSNDPDHVNALLRGFVAKHVPVEHAGYNLMLQPLKEMHFDSRLSTFSGHTFNKNLITALSLIGIFLLVVACVNFINLSTANAVNRAKEVGVRKALGSSRGQLLLQFFGETGAACILALAGALVVCAICLPLLNNLLEIQLSLKILLQPSTILFITLSLLLVTTLSGFYPALVLAGFNPINALKSRVAIESGKGITLRRGLVVFQFTIAQMLIIGTLIVVAQMNYFNNADMGFSKTAIINAGFPGDSAGHSKINLLRNQLGQISGIKEVSFSAYAPADERGWATDLQLSSNHTKKADLIVVMKPADTAYFSLYNLPFAAGRAYYASDTVREYVVNETLVGKLKLGSPQQALGQLINVDGKTAPIVGVIKDFHLHSLKEGIDPVVMIPSKRQYQITNIKIEPGKTKEVISAMENIWNKHFPDFVFQYNFIDQTIADYYKQERQLSRLYTIFAGIAIFISCLGLYGLISFMAVRKRKEIGIRKVLGAPVANIILLLSSEFSILIAIAFLIAAPVAWYCMHGWLDQYTFRIDIGIGFFVITFLSSILIAWLSVGHTTIRAAIANPVESLRTE